MNEGHRTRRWSALFILLFLPHCGSGQWRQAGRPALEKRRVRYGGYALWYITQLLEATNYTFMEPDLNRRVEQGKYKKELYIFSIVRFT